MGFRVMVKGNNKKKSQKIIKFQKRVAITVFCSNKAARRLPVNANRYTARDMDYQPVVGP